MTVMTSTYPTLLDRSKTLDPNGKTARFIELLTQANPILQDMHVIEGNEANGHRSTVDVTLPPAYWRAANQGVIPGKGSEAQISEQAGLLEAFNVIDPVVANYGGDPGGYHMQRMRKQLEGINQEMGGTTVYGNAGVAPNEFTGFMPRMSSLSAGNAMNVIDAGGTGGDNASILIIRWGDGVFGFFPQGSEMGVQHKVLKDQLIQNANGVTGAMMLADVDNYKWNIGLATPDWRDMVRVCNIDVSNLVADSSAADLTDQIEHGLACLPSGGLGTTVIYANRTVLRKWRKQQREDVSAGGGLTFENVAGQRVAFFDGIPVRQLDQMINTESRVT